MDQSYQQVPHATAQVPHDIPEAHWEYARILASTYKPEIVLWMLRDVSVRHELNYTIQGVGSTGITAPPHRGCQSSTASNTEGFGNNNRPEQISTAPWPSSSKQVAETPNRWFCVYDNHQNVSFGKQSDWKKHMTEFHKPGKKAWKCPESECIEFFESEKAFCQHHRKIHRCRRPCNHGNSVKIKSTRRAFACGRQGCKGLFSSWDGWIAHVAEHMVNGMTLSQWQYNTLFRNLLRRPEIEEIWKKYVATAAYPYNVSPRFNWRPHNTREQKANLEYLDGHNLELNAGDLVLQAYQTGMEIRSVEELPDPSVLITEPVDFSTTHLHSASMLNVPESPTANPQKYTRPFQLSPSSETLVPEPSLNSNRMAIDGDDFLQLNAYKTTPSVETPGGQSPSTPSSTPLFGWNLATPSMGMFSN